MNDNTFYTRNSNAENLDWSKIRWFRKEEFPLEELCLLDKKVVEELDKVRDVLEVPIHISPAEGAVIRQDNFHGHTTRKSYHYFCHETGRLGQAIDVFVGSLIPFASPMQIIMRILGSSRFRGLGLYFDTSFKNQRCLMLHLDLRPDPLVWFTAKIEGNKKYRKYFYPRTKDGFMTIMEELFLTLKEEDTSDEEVCLRPRGLPENHEKST